MATNEHGILVNSPEDEMWAFDRLPKTLRETINNARHNFGATLIYHEWRSKARTCRELIRVIQAWDAELAKQTRVK
jgi:hypothetical protein